MFKQNVRRLFLVMDGGNFKKHASILNLRLSFDQPSLNRL
jgi:hypothetical protein